MDLPIILISILWGFTGNRLYSLRNMSVLNNFKKSTGIGLATLAQKLFAASPILLFVLGLIYENFKSTLLIVIIGFALGGFIQILLARFKIIKIYSTEIPPFYMILYGIIQLICLFYMGSFVMS